MLFVYRSVFGLADRSFRNITNMFVMKLFLNQVAGMNSRSATLDLLKRNFHQGGLLGNTLEFAALVQKRLR